MRWKVAPEPTQIAPQLVETGGGWAVRRDFFPCCLEAYYSTVCEAPPFGGGYTGMEQRGGQAKHRVEGISVFVRIRPTTLQDEAADGTQVRLDKRASKQASKHTKCYEYHSTNMNEDSTLNQECLVSLRQCRSTILPKSRWVAPLSVRSSDGGGIGSKSS